MRVCILGGTGFIGRHVARQLAEAGADVTTVERGTIRCPASTTASLQADRNDPAALRVALATAAPTIVVDMVAYQERVVESLLGALPPTVERLVVISSGDVYASYGAFLDMRRHPADARPSTEESPLRTGLFPYRREAQGPDDPLFWYEKILVERAALAWQGGATTILRLPMVYGPNDRHRRVSKYLDKFRAGAQVLRLNSAEGAWRCTRGYVEDVAAAIKLAVLSEHSAGEVFNLGEPDALSEAAWAQAIARVAGWKGEIVLDPTAAAERQANWSIDLVADTQRIRSMLGFSEPFGRELGLQHTVADIE
jgi:nucleoside-diphosphate-sugar epimerase